MVYDFVQKKKPERRNIIAIKGIEGAKKPVITSRTNYKNKDGLEVFNVSAHASNQLLMDFLDTKKPGPGYCNLPRFYKKTTFYDEINAMRKVKTIRRGHQVTKWVQDPSRKCEANDCRRYAIAALYYLEFAGESTDDTIKYVNSFKKDTVNV